MANFLKSRKSVREFKKKKIDLSTLEQISLSFKELEQEDEMKNVRFKLYENGEIIYNGLKGIGGYAGVMIESPHYIAIELKDESDETIIYSAYYTEKLISKLNNMGISSCWVSIVDVNESTKRLVFGEHFGTVNYLLAIGYSKPKNPFIQEPFSERYGVEEIVFDKEIGNPVSMEELEVKGQGDLFFYVRFAPSTKNLQPWRFIVHGTSVKLLIVHSEGEEPILADAGIIMYYFEALANTQGIKNKWKMLSGSVKQGDLNYKYIAEIQL